MVDLQELTAAKIAELQSEIEVQKLEASMNLFYAMMNPDKLALVPKLARKFAKKDKLLNAELQKNYNGLDLSSNLETLLKEAKVEKELADLKEQLTEEGKKRAQLEESLLAKSRELQKVLSLLESPQEAQQGSSESIQTMEQVLMALRRKMVYTSATYPRPEVRATAEAP